MNWTYIYIWHACYFFKSYKDIGHSKAKVVIILSTFIYNILFILPSNPKKVMNIQFSYMKTKIAIIEYVEIR